ncbi:hypothetical protein GQR58_020528 [Nymphon striatum]|nr:hypothetical protein GQR58_020528 [Nymphon striatum]
MHSVLRVAEIFRSALVVVTTLSLMQKRFFTMKVLTICLKRPITISASPELIINLHEFNYCIYFNLHNCRSRFMSSVVSQHILAAAKHGIYIVKGRGMSLKSIYSHDILLNSSIFEGDLASKPEKIKLVAEIEKHLDHDDVLQGDVAVVLNFVSKIRSYPKLASFDTLLRKLASAQHSMETRILGVSWRDRKTNSWVRTETGCKDLTQTVKGSKWNWAGHLSRRTDDRWTTKSTIWITDRGGRKRGKPKRWWVDDIAKFDSDWVDRAADREDWRSRREAFAQQ